jgi:midasin
VRALKCGQWIILDELNLAPSEVLEALNRLLDDNRELYVPETQETVRPHAHFSLFATQNPVGLYGGRKPLSQALRNRFTELQMEDIPSRDLVSILTQRARLPASFAERMVGVMEELQRLRAGSHDFAGKDGFITPRDLLRWAARRPRTYAELAQEGYMLLAERKDAPERSAVRGALQASFRVELDVEAMYDAPFAAAGAGGGAGGRCWRRC